MLIVKSFAKINLWLSVLGKRSDGYHEIRTVLQSVDLHDDLRVEPAACAIRCLCNEPGIPQGPENLIVAAATRLRDACGVNAGATFHLEKRIPVGGGLGGGSSNAAMALLLAARLWKIEISLPDLLGIAGKVGSDVPFFLVGGLCLATGRGEEVVPLREPAPMWVVIAGSGRPLSTRLVYEKASALLTRTGPEAKIRSLNSFLSDGLSRDLLSLTNDLEEAAQSFDPEILTLKTLMFESGAKGALLSGSGSSVFGLFDDMERAKRASQAAGARGYTALLCATLPRLQYRKATALKQAR